MSMVKIFCIAFPIFLVIDGVWLALVAKNFYATQLGFLMKSDVNWTAAILFYILFIIGLAVFVIAPSMEKGSWVQALVLGAFFGLVTYATYDLTNLATVKNWPMLVTVVDLIWGMTVSATVSVLTYGVYTKWFS